MLNKKINELKKKLENPELPDMNQANISGMIIAYEDAQKIIDDKVKKLKEVLKNDERYGTPDAIAFTEEIDKIMGEKLTE